MMMIGSFASIIVLSFLIIVIVEWIWKAIILLTIIILRVADLTIISLSGISFIEGSVSIMAVSLYV